MPPERTKQVNVKAIVGSMAHRISRVDEVVARSNQNARIPVFPKLKLPRPRVTVLEKVQIPLHVTSVQFPSPRN